MTIRKEVEFAGIGIHTGEFSKVRLIPATESDAGKPPGIIFWRNGVAIPAHINFAVSSHRCVVLSNENESVSTVEHLLATLWAFGITDVHILVDGAEVPIGEGDALHWVRLLKEAGKQELPYKVDLVYINEPVEVRGERIGPYALATPSDRLSIRYTFVHEHPFIGVQNFYCDNLREAFVSEIAPARTFGFIEEVERLLRMGLGRGGSLQNCVIIFSNGYSTPLRFKDELVRHKVLDLLGDMSLLCAELVAQIDVYSGGHSLHMQLMKRIWEKVMEREKRVEG